MKRPIFILFLFMVGSIFQGTPLLCQEGFTASEEALLEKSSDRRISMDFQNANLKDVLKIFSQQSGLNFIASQQIQDKTVTLYLEDVSVKDALDKLLNANNLTYELHNNIFTVKQLGEPEVTTITKVIPLKYARVSTSALSKEISDNLKTTASTAIKDAVEKMLTSYGKVIEDPRTNSLVVADIPSQLTVIEQMIQSLDVPAAQVLIEVEMLDVSKNVADTFGINFSGEWLDFTGASRSTAFPFGKDWINSATATRTFTMGTLSAVDLTAALNFLTSQSDTRYLARPRLRAINNEPAEIKLIANEAIGNVQQLTAGEGTTTSTTAAERYETGVSLRFTPQINVASGEIVMYLEPKISETRASNISTTVRDPEDRGTKSVVQIKDGETLMIGGLLRTRYSSTIRKVPILGDIPILGWFFKYKNVDRDEDRELIVFLTPHIIKEGDFAETMLSKVELEREQTNGLKINPKREYLIDKSLKEWGY